MRKLGYFILTLSFIFIVSGGFSSFLIGLKNDKQATLRQMEDVGDKFEVFSANTSIFENYRDELYANVLEGVVCSNFVSSDQEIKNKLSNYENLVDELKKNTNSMKKLCNDVYYPDSSTNNKCSNYKNIYEQVVNYFVSDINVYNKNIKECNKADGSLVKLEEYKTNKKYIDYNGDKKFDGKVEE